MPRLLTRLRVRLNRTRLAGWLECLAGNHVVYHHLDEQDLWWWRCERPGCDYVREDQRLYGEKVRAFRRRA